MLSAHCWSEYKYCSCRDQIRKMKKHILILMLAIVFCVKGIRIFIISKTFYIIKWVRTCADDCCCFTTMTLHCRTPEKFLKFICQYPYSASRWRCYLAYRFPIGCNVNDVYLWSLEKTFTGLLTDRLQVADIDMVRLLKKFVKSLTVWRNGWDAGRMAST